MQRPKESRQVLAATETTGDEFVIYGESAIVSLEGTIAGNWVVESARDNAATRVWRAEFEVGDALTTAIPLAQIQGSPTRVYRITGGTAGVEGFVDDVYSIVWR